MPRKADKTRDATKFNLRYLSFEKVDDGDTVCIEVAAKDHLYLCGEGYILTHNSCIVSEFFPAFCLGHHPEWEMVGATYNQTIADNFGRKVRTLINTPEYLDLFPALTLDDSANAMNYIATTARGSYTAVGMGGA